MIRLTVPSIDEEDLAAVREVLESGFLVQGRHVQQFEARVADYLAVDHAVAVANCTSALHLSLLALGIGRGDRVAVTAYSWPATANVIELVGAEPVFVDVDPGTFNIDPAGLTDVLASASIRAILPVHTFGGMADMTAICSLAANRGVPVVEDAACALGSSLDGRLAGTWGVIGCFSFHPRKAITTGEGGMVVTNDAALARSARMLRNHGQDPDASAPDFVLPGYNLRLTEFQAALGVTQLAKLERLIAVRRSQAQHYDELLSTTSIVTPAALPGSRHVYQSYVALLPRAAAPRRQEILADLRREGIEATIGTYHIPMTSYFRSRYKFKPGRFPVTDDIAARAITLPLYDGLQEGERSHVVEALCASVAKNAG